LRERLRGWLGLAPGDHAVVLEALEADDRPLRAAYARVAHLTVVDLRERLAAPADHDRRAWPTFEAYRAFVLRSQRHSRRRDAHLLGERFGSAAERSWRFAGLDFHEIIVRARAGSLAEVEFVPDRSEGEPRFVVRLPQRSEQ
jgi:hypothetical protein